MTSDSLLANLNASQRAAVSSFADTLAILAGPGSGKTHTLTSRTAWLLHQGLKPWNIIVATFTVKAAREMKERIGRLIGNGLESRLILGTFHSISRRYLAHYGHLINIRKDFGIADSSDSLAIIKRITKRHNLNIDPKVARSRISSRKARGNSNVSNELLPKKTVDAQEFETCYTEYEAALARSNLLDYDDLLLRCVELLRTYPSCVSNVEAVLIDEFQDTNLVQFDLMRLFAAERKRITIVGDPDQSIYGFRAAEIKNYKYMLGQYPDTVTIPLEENYRSSGAILLTALNVIEQDSSRIAKSLMPTHTVGTRPVLRKLPNAHKEAQWIVSEVQRCKGLTGELLDLNDFAILLRSASLSRLIESALGNAGIAYRMVGGLKFYDRVEVKTVLDYLRVVNQPDNNDALARIINVPSRRIGEVTIKSLLEESDQSKMTLWSLILGVIQGKRAPKTSLPKQTEQGLSSFVNIILTARKKLADQSIKCSIIDLIGFILKKTDFEGYLEHHHGDVHKARWANVQELLTQATDFHTLISCGYEDESLPQIAGLDQEDASDPLSKFLANVALASDVKNDDAEGAPMAQVTISTIHAAKGLEWPVVFIPAVYQGSIPHSRAEDSDEERRLLYVAMTRSKALLYMSYPLRNSQGEQTTLSPFLTSGTLEPLLEQRGPSLLFSTVQSISQILRRPVPSPESISASSAFLESREDGSFQVEGDDKDAEDESRWNHSSGQPSFTMGQRPSKRQRVETGTSDKSSNITFKGNYITTMDKTKTSGFTTAFLTLSSGFVSAAQIQPHINEDSNQSISQASTKPNATMKGSIKRAEGQGTLHTFLGKPEPPPPVKKSGSARSAFNISIAATIDQPREMLPYLNHGVNGISPELAGHRLGANSSTSRPRHAMHIEQHKRNDYVFLSSSPPRPKPPEAEIETLPEKPLGLTSKPALLPIIRPPLSMHTTSIAMVQERNTKKTLGVKRSMNGWGSRSGQAFVPPTMKRNPFQ
ncbi:hypothetical protein B7494_g7828 [Chlorociboria aeruginascens]|nr:hypothetical protein B7494_g7828 [Chlorociboria aeruginascens]